MRAAWRRMKAPAVTERSSWWRTALLRLGQPLASRLKHLLPTSGLRKLSLWLAYHPEYGIPPCDAGCVAHPPHLNPDEIVRLKARLAEDREAVARRLGLEWLDVSRISPKAVWTPKRVAVHVHDFYPDVMPRIEKALGNVPVPFDLFVSSPTGESPCPNRGRDIAPLICRYGKTLADYDYIAHFHTKKSRHAAARGDWLGHELETLLGSPERVSSIFSLLRDGYGMVAARDFLSRTEDPTGWQHNLPAAEAFVRRIGLDLDLRRDYTPIFFPQGSMFWARGDFMRDFLSLPISFEDFPEEPIGADGTLAHVLERLLFVLGSRTGRRIAIIGREKTRNPH